MRVKNWLPSHPIHTFGVFFVLATLLFSFIGSTWSPNIANAQGEEFVFAYPTGKDKIDVLSKIFKDKDTDNPALEGTSIFSRKGIWGNGSAELGYGKPVLPDGTDKVCDIYSCNIPNEDNVFFYNITFSCVQENGKWVPKQESTATGYGVQMVVAIDLGPNFDTASTHQYTVFTGRITERGSGNQVTAGSVPQECRVHARTGTMGNYAALSESEKAAWNRQASVDILDEKVATAIVNAGGTNPDEADVCDELGDLGWIICPVAKGVVKAIDGMDSAINTLLTVDTDPIFGSPEDTSSSSNKYYQAWNGFRVIALGLIIIASLIVIIATAFGYEILDAYTIRKVLPRVLIAIIFIALSWNILEFLITLTNDVGNGVRALIYRPFNGWNGVEFDASIGIITNLLLGAGLIAMGPMAVLSFGVTALLAVIIAFLVLVIRELLIIFLVLIAPIGIACLILPNTRKGWQLWQNTFTAMLIVFPIISAMIATGRVFSMTVNTQSGNLLNEVIAFAAYLLPYFLLPFAFRAAGGLMATLAGLANDRSRGAFDRLKKYRGGELEKNMGKMKAGNRFTDRNMLTRGFNRTTSGIGMGYQGRFGLRERGRQGRSQLEEISALNQVMKDPKWQGVHQNDDALHALTYGSAAEAKAALTQRWNGDTARAERAVQAAQASVKFGRPQQIAAARQLVSTGTGYDDINDMAATLGRVSGGNMNTAASLAGFANSEAKKVGRGDLAPSFGTLSSMAQFAGNTGAGEIQDNNAVMQNAWESVSLYQHGNGKPTAIKNFANHYENQLRTGSQEQQVQALAFFNDLKNMKSGANGAVSSEIDKVLAKNSDVIRQVSGQSATQVTHTTMDSQGNESEVITTVGPGTDKNGVPLQGPARPMTLGEHAAGRARSYRDPRPDDR